jgi:hypothetical protein
MALMLSTRFRARPSSRSWTEWWLVAQASIVMTALVLARALPDAAWRRFGLRLGRLHGRNHAATVVPRQVVRAVDAASRIVPGGSNCLVRALAARTLLARRGIRSELVFGVARGPAGVLRAHAWLRYQDELLLGDKGIEGFVQMPNLAGRF